MIWPSLRDALLKALTLTNEWPPCVVARSSVPESATRVGGGRPASISSVVAQIFFSSKMQLTLPVLVATALVAQGDAADVRGLLRQHVMAAALQDAGAQQTIGGNKTLCTAPAEFFFTQPGGCTSAQSPIYVLLTDAPYTNMYIQACGTPCTYKDTIDYNANVGGYSCAGNKKVDIAIPGVSSATLASPGTAPQCVPCSDREIATAPQDKANLAACGITDMLFGTMVKGTVGVANTIAAGTVAVGKTIASGATQGWNKVQNGVVDLSKTIASGTVNLGNTIAKGTVDLGKDIGKTFKGWGR